MHKTQFNALPSQGEINNQPSKTVPDQSLSIKQIMQRYASGLPLEGQRVPIYEGEEDNTPDFERMDLAEREAYKRDIEAQLIDINRRIKETDDEKVKAAKEAAEAKNREKNQTIEEATVIDEELPKETKSKKK